MDEKPAKVSMESGAKPHATQKAEQENSATETPKKEVSPPNNSRSIAIRTGINASKWWETGGSEELQTEEKIWWEKSQPVAVVTEGRYPKRSLN